MSGHEATRDTPGGDVPVLLECHAVTKHFGGVTALRGANLTVKPGEVMALLGQNGAGKSTLIAVVAGVHRPDGGLIRLVGREVEFRSAREARVAGIRVVFQNLSLVPSLSVRENLVLGQEAVLREEFGAGALRRGALDELAREALRVVGSEASPRDLVGGMRFGERQLVEVAKALLGKGRVLILDEPTAGLGGRETERLHEVVRELRKQGFGIVYVSHRLKEVSRIADRVTILRDGRVVLTEEMRETDVAGLVSAIVGGEPGAPRSERPSQEAASSLAGWRVAQAEADSRASIARKERLSRGVEEAGPVSAPGVAALEMKGVSAGPLHGVSLVVRAGEIVGLAGVVGSGQSEVLEVAFGLRRFHRGELLIQGTRISPSSPRDAIRHQVAMVGGDRQVTGVVEGLAVWTNLELPRLSDTHFWNIVSRSRAQREASQLVQKLGIKCGGIAVNVETLSGGNQQKVAVGKWWWTSPATILLDEPTAGVDVGAKGEIHRQLRELASGGTGILVASSDFGELLELCDRVIVMANGQVVEEIKDVGGLAEEQLHMLVQTSAA